LSRRSVGTFVSKMAAITDIREELQRLADQAAVDAAAARSSGGEGAPDAQFHAGRQDAFETALNLVTGETSPPTHRFVLATRRALLKRPRRSGTYQLDDNDEE